jgi:hypothetical protein
MGVQNPEIFALVRKLHLVLRNYIILIFLLAISQFQQTMLTVLREMHWFQAPEKGEIGHMCDTSVTQVARAAA